MGCAIENVNRARTDTNYFSNELDSQQKNKIHKSDIETKLSGSKQSSVHTKMDVHTDAPEFTPKADPEHAVRSKFIVSKNAFCAKFVRDSIQFLVKYV